MIKCTDCKQEKDLSEFQKKPNNKHYNQCKDCRRALVRKHYALNKDKYRANVKAFRQRFRDFLVGLKNQPCVDCKIKYDPWIMQFDHIDSTTKTMDISDIMCKVGSRKLLLEEVSKCELVCANCHADRTYKRLKNLSN